jgi:putative hydrolase of the HAD superfamily
VVTNGNPTVQRFKVRATGLDRFLDAVVISGEIGVGKPGLAIFQHACELLGVSPADTVMIGDSLNTDVRGAQAAGMRSVWLNRGGSQRRSPDRHPRPDLEIAGLDDLFRSR